MPPSPQARAAGAAGDHLVAELGDVSIAYETFGDAANPTLLLVMGLGMQLLGWDEGFCRQLAERGFHVVRFDNRDVGLSTKLSPHRARVIAGMLGFTGSAPYSLDEMAADTVALANHIGAERIHLVGASMGGMIAQKVAARHRHRVLSLCSIMSSSGRRRPATVPRPDAMRALLRKPPTDREGYIEDLTRTMQQIGSPAYPTEPDRLRERAGAGYDRSFYPPGTARQIMAVLASGDRTAELRTITAPTVVIHGAADRLMPPAAGRQVAAAIPGARYVEIEGMGHDLPVALWPRLLELIAANAAPAF